MEILRPRLKCTTCIGYVT